MARNPLVPFKKKDGEVRWCVDFRQMNDWMVDDSFPIPHIEELVQKTAEKKLYSALDCFAAYNQIRVHPYSLVTMNTYTCLLDFRQLY
jgi:putative transposase